MADANFLFGRDTLDFGPCNLYYDTAMGGENLFMGCFDSLVFRNVVDKLDLMCAQEGSSPADRAVTGQTVQVEVGLAQATADRSAAAVQNLQVEKDSLGVVTQIYGSSVIGQRDSTIAKQYTIYNIIDGAETTDPLEIVNIWKMAPTGSAEWTFDAATQRFTSIQYQAYIDNTQTDSLGRGTYWGTNVLTP